MAEEKQKTEREKQKQMKGKIDKIRAVFKGDERYMITSTLYRQNNYHPIYALSNSLDLFIQIPFFIAAYHFLHNLELLNGQKFKFIADLGVPDGLLWGVNLFPILMTFINCVSGAIYAKSLQLKDKIQLYGIALVFLVLLYNSPAALVLYWTCNNIYNLVKNIILKKIEFNKKIIIKNTVVGEINKIFALSVIGIFLLVGLVIPSSLIASSVEEFSFIKPFSSPLPFIGITLLQSAGILLWLVCIYCLFTKRIRRIMTFIFTATLGVFMVNVFCFKTNYGSMTPDLVFSYFSSVSAMYKIINILVVLFTATVIIFILLIKKEKILLALQSILIISLFCFGIANIFKINKNFINVYAVREGGIVSTSDNFVDLKKYYTFSKNGKNLVLIMLDKAVSGYVPYIFEEKPELFDSFKGFTYYPNTISFGQMTLHGLSGIFGGYYYTPLSRQNRKDENFYDKLHESLLILPRIMAESGFNVSIYNQSYIDNSIYNSYENITAQDKPGDYTEYYLNNVNPIRLMDFNKILYNNLIRFSLFKTLPIIFNSFIYNDGKYLSLFKVNNYHNSTIGYYSSFYFHSNITEIKNDNSNYATIVLNSLTHYPAFMQYPDYIPSDNITDYGNGQYSREVFYHINMASLILLAKWFDFLKENGVYDNTRIIIVSDHGTREIKPFPKTVNIPDTKYWQLEASIALLLVKDFNAEFEFKTDNTFMTNADVPHIATEGLVYPLTNPFTGKEMFMDKNSGVTITTCDTWEPEKLIREGIKPDEWLHVKDNIFELKNWSKVIIKD
jgi:hypothetical protein